MFSWLTEKLGNVSVNRKLGVGFGLVLLMTVLSTFAGWDSLSSVISRADKQAAIAHLNETAKDLRVARLEYEMRRGEQGPAAVNDLLGKLQEGLQAALKQFVRAVDQQMFNQQLAILDEYKRAFNDLTQATDNRESARSKLGATADNAVAKVAEVEKSLLQGDSIAQFNSVIELSKLIQQARFQVRGYTYSGKTEAEQPALEAIDDALKNLASLPSRLPEQHIANLQQATESLKGYRAAVSLFRDSQVASAAALKRMMDQDALLKELNNELTISQVEKRDQETAQAKNTLIIVALLALAFGLLAAWLITRQIVAPLQQTLIAVERVASGDLSQNLEVSRRDEMGQLQGSLQRMVVSLRELIGGIRDGVTQIASAAEQLSAVTEQTSAGVNSQKVE
ncbi:methyl-accepting chemotaxis protein, partial [Pseudomonas corrugata]